MQCPRRREAPHISDNFKREDDTQGDKCIYCGSLTEEAFLKAIEDNCRLGTTTKNYKIYVYRPNPLMHQKRIVGTANFDKSGCEGWVQATEVEVEIGKRCGYPVELGKWVLLGPQEEYNQDKFYFQHLSQENMKKFVDWINEGKLKLDHPFNPYPFFVAHGGV